MTIDPKAQCFYCGGGHCDTFERYVALKNLRDRLRGLPGDPSLDSVEPLHAACREEAHAALEWQMERDMEALRAAGHTVARTGPRSWDVRAACREDGP